MSNEDEFYCGRTELIQTNENKNKILIPIRDEKCGTKENPHECIREVVTNMVAGSTFRCRKCSKTFRPDGRRVIIITWNDE